MPWWFRAKLEEDLKTSRQAGGRLPSPDPESNKEQPLKNANCYGQRQSIKTTTRRKKKQTTHNFLTSNRTTNISHNFCASKSNSAHQLTDSRKQLFYYYSCVRSGKGFQFFSTSPRQMLSSSLGQDDAACKSLTDMNPA